MKNLDLNAYGVKEMSHQEMVETDGGGIITGLIIVGAALLLASCGSKGSNGNGNTVNTVVIKGDSNTVEITTQKK